jgi:hypothetical protein
MKLNKLTKILSVGLLLHLPMVAEAATPSRLVTTQVSIVDANGYPVENGEYSWKTVDGLAKSSKKILGTGLGVVELNSIPTKEVELSMDFGKSAEGFCVSGKATFTPKSGNFKFVLPAFDQPTEMEVVVELPGGHPVPNAYVDSRDLAFAKRIESENFSGGVSGTRRVPPASWAKHGWSMREFQCLSYTYPNMSTYYPSFNQWYDGKRQDGVTMKGLTNSVGIAILKGWPISDSIRAQAIFDDGVLYQKTEMVETNPDGPTTLTLDYFPILKTSSDDIEAYMNELVSLPISVDDSFEAEAMSFSRFISEPRASRASLVAKPSAAFAGIQVEVVAPPSSKGAKCSKKQTLKAKTTSKGKALLKVCVTTSGNYEIKGKGAIGIGKVSIQVKGAPPMAPTALSSKPGVKKATVAWGLPTYAGGAPILKYVITATASGQKTKKIEVKANTTAFKLRKLDITGLTAPKNWQISVVSVTKNGESEKASVFVNVPNN